MSYSATRRCALAAGVLLVIASPLIAARRATARIAVRPSVALQVSIDAVEYLEKLDDANCTRDCLTLRDALADSALAIVRGAYPFLNWDDAENATDTVNLRLTSKGIDAPWSLLELRIRSRERRMERDSLPLDFEQYPDFQNRDARNDWSVDSLARQWPRHIRKLLLNQNLVEPVFGRIPINAPVTVAGVIGRVKVRGREIFQADDNRPAFEITTQIHDPVTGDDEVRVRLSPCRGKGWPDYNCDVAQIIYPSGDTVRGPRLDALLGRATFDASSRARLVLFKADTARGGLGGATWR